jgi:SAM-dependent MidA family methyltransferase
VAVERSASRRALQSGNLDTHIQSAKFASKQELSDEIPSGCIFSNELIDAMPVHRVIRERNDLGEIYVGLGKNGLCDELGPLSSSALETYFSDQGISLQEEQQAEVNLAARRWISEAGEKLRRGFVITIDYGHQASELYNERHMRGTLLAYERHRTTENVYRAPGGQDLTAHVNFSALDIYGLTSGLSRTGFTSQCNFLLALARDGDFADLQSDDMTEAEQTQRRLLFKTLINPEGMGETFQILIQHKGIARPSLAGLEPL